MTARKSTTKTEIAEKKSTDIVDPTTIIDFADAGGGMENADKESYAIPFLTVLQKISPQVDEDDGAYVPGAKGGMLYNTVTQSLYDGKEGVTFIPCAYQRRFLHWGPRGSESGGFKGEVMPEDAAAMRERGEVVEYEGKLYFPTADGEINPKKCDLLADTRLHFGLLLNEEGHATEVLLSLSSTQIKKSKQLMSALNAVKVNGPKGAVTPPTWMNRVVLTVVPESNDKGSWYGIRPTLDGFIASKELYDAGKRFHDLIAAGEAKVNFDDAAAPGNTSSDEEKPGDGF